MASIAKLMLEEHERIMNFIKEFESSLKDNRKARIEIFYKLRKEL